VKRAWTAIENFATTLVITLRSNEYENWRRFSTNRISP
jgi:hypothetical protein